MDQCARQGNALLLAAAQLGGRAIIEITKSHKFQHTFGAFPNFRRRHACNLERETDIAAHGHVWPNRIALKYHADLSVLRFDENSLFAIEHHVVAQGNPPGSGHFQPGNATQGRGLAATAGTQQGNRGARIYGKLHIANCWNGAVIFLQALHTDRYILSRHLSSLNS